MGYDAKAAVEYAKYWALERNPRYFNFDKFGGDCTNFVSQCVFAGTGKMDYTPVLGWYYISPDNRTAAWSAAGYLYNFLVRNKGNTVLSTQIEQKEVNTGDVVQLKNTAGKVYHSLFVTGISDGEILVCAHTLDSLMRPLSSYTPEAERIFWRIDA